MQDKYINIEYCKIFLSQNKMAFDYLDRKSVQKDVECLGIRNFHDAENFILCNNSFILKYGMSLLPPRIYGIANMAMNKNQFICIF